MSTDRTTIRADLLDLIERMARNDMQGGSEVSVSWHAYRDAEKLSDLSLIPDLESFLALKKTTRDEREAVYKILGCLGENCSNGECAAVLIRHIPKEMKNKFTLHTLLDALAHPPKAADLDLSPVFECLKDPRWLVRHSAMRSLVKTVSPLVEGKILEILPNAEDHYDEMYCFRTLREVGTVKNLPALEQGMTSRKRDVKFAASSAIDAIKARLADTTEGKSSDRP